MKDMSLGPIGLLRTSHIRSRFRTLAKAPAHSASARNLRNPISVLAKSVGTREGWNIAGH